MSHATATIKGAPTIIACLTWLTLFLSAKFSASWTLQSVKSTSATHRRRKDLLSVNMQANGDDAVSSRGRRQVLDQVTTSVGVGVIGNAFFQGSIQPAFAIPTIDVNNAMAREFTAFPGLYPTIATKVVNGAKAKPFTSKKQIYELLSEGEAERLKQYDKSLIISKPDKQLQQFKTSQICKYECGSRTSNAYRDEQIKAVQAGRMGVD